MNEGMKKLRES